MIGCAGRGHVLVGADAATIPEDDPLAVREIDAGHRLHRCLRCDAWMMLPTPTKPTRRTPDAGRRTPDAGRREETTLPTRGRPLKSRYVLRLIALTRAFNVLVLLLVLGGVVAVLANQTALRESLVGSASALQDVIGGQVVGSLQSLLSGGAGPLWLVAVGIAVLLGLESAEGIGLWRGTRWGEYLTFVMTTLLLVPEAFELVSSSSPGTIVGMIINAAVVIYLLVSKRLFGLRGGAPAVRAEHDHDISWAALERHLPDGATETGAIEAVSR